MNNSDKQPLQKDSPAPKSKQGSGPPEGPPNVLFQEHKIYRIKDKKKD